LQRKPRIWSEDLFLW